MEAIGNMLEGLLGPYGMALLHKLFVYDKESPLTFLTFYFWGFFAVILIGYSFMYPNRAVRNAFLFVVSLFFYYKSSGVFFVILLFSTVVDYLIAFLIDKSETLWKRKLWTALSVCTNLGILLFFKYSFFLTESFNSFFGTDIHYYNAFNAGANAVFGTNLPLDKLILPVGVSFYTFQTISYAVDVYRRQIKPVRSIVDFGFFVTYFPQLVAGPIVRAAEFIPQLYQPYRLNNETFSKAVWWIAKGMAKKVILADYIGVNFVDRVFENPELFTGFENMFALYGYSMQVYGDFAGYTDIAIGVSLLLGFTLPTNFNAPYKARSVAEFWKRWHMSLSTWLRDYLYIPLGGNRGATILSWCFYLLLPFLAVLKFGVAYLPYIGLVFGALVLLFMYLGHRYESVRKHLATNSNLMWTMLLGGFWHGANWNFVIWGGLNGTALVVHRYWKKISPYEGSKHWVVIAWTTFLTFTFITFTRVYFRSPDLATVDLILDRIFGDFGWRYIPAVVENYANVFYVIYAGLIIHWLPDKMKADLLEIFVRSHVAVKAVFMAALVFFIYQAMSSDLQPFIYFQF